MLTIIDKRPHDSMFSNDKKEMENQNNNNTTKTNVTVGYTL